MNESEKLNKKFKESMAELTEASEVLSKILSSIVFYITKFILLCLFIIGLSIGYMLMKFYYWIKNKFANASN